MLFEMWSTDDVEYSLVELVDVYFAKPKMPSDRVLNLQVSQGADLALYASPTCHCIEMFTPI